MPKKKKEVKAVEGEVEVKRKAGRPPAFFYTEDKAEQMLDILSKGGDVSDICVAWGIKSKKTFYNHLDKNEDLKNDYEFAKMHMESYIEGIARDVIVNSHHPKYKHFNTKLFMWWAANKCPDRFSHSTKPGGSTVNIGSINTVNQAPKLEHEQIMKELEQLSQDPELLKELKDIEPAE